MEITSKPEALDVIDRQVSSGDLAYLRIAARISQTAASTLSRSQLWPLSPRRSALASAVCRYANACAECPAGKASVLNANTCNKC
eukprot:351965-Chlamydomonas_euryale.AAC.13